MLEQAVYAGRNHTFSLAVACVVAALFASPARADDVVRVGLGSTIEEMIAGPNGGVWVTIDRGNRVVVGTATPGSRFVTAGLDDTILGSAVGPDGQAWFHMYGRRFARVDSAGRLTNVGPIPRPGAGAGDTLATGPDGTLWALTPGDRQIAHINAQGTTTFSASHVPKCDDSDSPILMSMRRAADGAMWLADTGCERLLRMTAAGTTEIAIPDGDPGAIAADASGGMWFTQERGGGHVDVNGTVKRFELPDWPVVGTAVAPDGSAWFASGRCTLARVAPDGAISSVSAPIPTRQIAFDPSGGLWLASRARLLHLAPGEAPGACDDRPPTVRISPGRDGGVVSLRALRQTGGLRIAVREPVAVDAFAFYFDDVGEGQAGIGRTVERVVTAKRGRTIRYRIPAARLARFERRLAEGRRPGLRLLVYVSDLEGNREVYTHIVRVTR